MTQSSSQGNSNSGPAVQAYFNIHTTGYGRLLRVREVQTRGEPFWACTIAALSGPRGHHATRYIDVRVTGRDAIDLVRNSKTDVDANKVVIVQFRVGDLWTDVFTKPEEEAGIGLSLKARLLKAIPQDPKVLESMPYFDLLTRAIGRLNYVQEGHDASTAPKCSFGAFKGKVGQLPEFCNFDLTVCGDEVTRLILDQAASVRAKRKVNVSVLLEDLEPSYYVPTTGANAGKPMPLIKSNLIEVSTIKVDGEEVFRAKPTDDPAREDAPAAESASAPQASSEQQPPKGKSKAKQQPTQAGQQPVTSSRSKALAKATPAYQQDSEFDEFTELDDIPF